MRGVTHREREREESGRSFALCLIKKDLLALWSWSLPVNKTDRSLATVSLPLLPACLFRFVWVILSETALLIDTNKHTNRRTTSTTSTFCWMKKAQREHEQDKHQRNAIGRSKFEILEQHEKRRNERNVNKSIIYVVVVVVLWPTSRRTPSLSLSFSKHSHLKQINQIKFALHLFRFSFFFFFLTVFLLHFHFGKKTAVNKRKWIQTQIC